jgi:hypothetical protein
VTLPGASEIAAEIARIDAEYKAEVEKIEADFGADRQTLERLNVDPETQRAIFWKQRLTGGRLMTFDELLARRDRELGKATRRYREALEALKLKTRLMGQDEPVAPEGPQPTPEERDELIGGRPYAEAQYVAAGNLYNTEKLSVAGVQKLGLSQRRAYKLYRQYKNGAVVYKGGEVRAGPGYEWDPALLAQKLYKLMSA